MSPAAARRLTPVLAAALLLLLPGCGYRWVMPGGPSALGLLPVVNATSEPRLSSLLADAFASEGGVRRGGGERGLEVAAVAFREGPALLVAGSPTRQAITLEVEWRVTGGGASGPVLGRGRQSVTREYPWSADPAALDWARQNTIALLARDAARAVLDRAEEVR